MQYPTVARLPAECRHNFNPLPGRDRLRGQCAVGSLAVVRTGNAITVLVLPADEYDSALRGRAASAVIARSIVELGVAARCSLGGLVGPRRGVRCSRCDVPIGTPGAWGAPAREVQKFCVQRCHGTHRKCPGRLCGWRQWPRDRRVHQSQHGDRQHCSRCKWMGHRAQEGKAPKDCANRNASHEVSVFAVVRRVVPPVATQAAVAVMDTVPLGRAGLTHGSHADAGNCRAGRGRGLRDHPVLSDR